MQKYNDEIMSKILGIIKLNGVKASYSKNLAVEIFKRVKQVPN